MITNGFMYVALLLFLAGCLIATRHYTQWKFFEYVPPIVLVYVLNMVFCTMGIWDLEATAPVYGALKNNLLYAMIFLMLLSCDIRKLVKLGPRMASGFFCASFTIMVGFVVAFVMFKGVLGADSWAPLAALCASWIGGSGNMAAVQAAWEIPTGALAAPMIIDTVVYSVWIALLLAMVSLEKKFNKFTRANTQVIDNISASLAEAVDGEKHPVNFPNLIFLLGCGLMASALCQMAGQFLGANVGFFDKGSYTVILVTLIGLVFALTPLGKMSGSSELNSLMLYTVISLMASRAGIQDLLEAPMWVAAGAVVMVIHIVLYLLLARLFHFDLFTCGVASLANIGGTASAPILAGAFNPALIPAGVLMGLFGTVTGTFLGMITGNIMRLLA